MLKLSDLSEDLKQKAVKEVREKYGLDYFTIIGDKFEEYFKCKLQYSYNENLTNNVITGIKFDNEEDELLFILRYS